MDLKILCGSFYSTKHMQWCTSSAQVLGVVQDININGFMLDSWWW